MATTNLFDRVLKILGRHYAATFLELIFPNSALELTGTQENVELSLPDHRIDFLHQLKAGHEEYLLHFEFQLQHETEFPRRMFAYSAELTDQYKKPVISVVLYLERRESEVPSEYAVLVGDSVIHRFTYPVLRLWDYEDRIRAGELPEFAPLLLLLAREKTEAVLQEEKALILRENDPLKRADLLATAVMIASRYFDVDWLWEFFSEEVKQMRQSTFITDWIQEAETTASTRVFQQGKLSLLIQLLEAKFGKLPEPIEERVRGLVSEEELDQLGIRILTANSLEEMGLDGKSL